MADRSVVVRLSAQVGGFTAGMAQAKQSTLDFSRTAEKSATKHRQDWDRSGKAMLVTGGVIAAGLAIAVKANMAFEKQLSAVRAVTNATVKDMDRLRSAALKAGADTIFSAKDAAKAETELAKVGISTSDILGGALTGALNLAAAGQLDLADAATISGQAMKIFNLQGKDVSHIADVLSAGANKSAADVGQLAQAMQQGGLVAAQTGMHLEDTVGVLSAFADNALIGSDAGTSLKTMLQRLTPQSQQAAKLMSDLGLSAYDASGNFIGLQQYAGLLQDKLKGMTAQQRNSTLQTLFGSDAVRGANVLYKIGAKGVADYTAAVNDQGAAARTAAIQMDNLSGDFENLKGSIETALIQAGSAGNDTLRSLAQSATGAINTFTGLPQPIQEAAFTIGTLTAGVALFGGAAALAVPRVLALDASIKTATKGAMGLRGALASLGPVAAVVGVAAASDILSQYVGRANTASVSTEKLAKSMTAFGNGKGLAGAGLDLFAGKGGLGLFTNQANDTADALHRFGVAAYNAFDQGWDARLGRLQDGGSSLASFQKQASQLDEAFAQMVRDGNAGQAAAAYEQFIGAVREEGGNGPAMKAAASFSTYQGALNDAAAAQKAAAGSADPAASGVRKVGGAAATAKLDVKGFSDALDALFSRTFNVEQATDAFHTALNDLGQAAKDNGRSLQGNSDKAIANREAMRTATEKAFGLIDAYTQSGASAKQVATKTAALKQEIYDTAVKAGYGKTQAKKYADALDGIKGTYKANLVANDGVSSVVETAKRALMSLQGKTIRTYIQSITTHTNQPSPVQGGIGSLLLPPPHKKNKADGGYISGPGGPRDDAIPAMLSNGEFVVRASAVKAVGVANLQQINRYADGGLVKPRGYATGGFVQADWSGVMSRIPSSAPSGQDRVDAINRRARAVASLHAAEAALWKVRKDKHHSAGEMARAEERLRNARSSVSSATSKLRSVEAARRAAAAPFSTKFHRASQQSNAHTKAFLHNVDVLRKRGFTTLADQLTMQADDQAYNLASAAVRSTGTARALTRDFAQSAANQRALDARQAKISGATGAPAAAWSMPAWSAPVYGARPSQVKTTQIVVKIGDKELTEIVGATVDGQYVQVGSGLIYGGG